MWLKAVRIARTSIVCSRMTSADSLVYSKTHYACGKGQIGVIKALGVYLFLFCQVLN